MIAEHPDFNDAYCAEVQAIKQYTDELQRRFVPFPNCVPLRDLGVALPVRTAEPGEDGIFRTGAESPLSEHARRPCWFRYVFEFIEYALGFLLYHCPHFEVIPQVEQILDGALLY